jgi:hypothetical protein
MGVHAFLGDKKWVSTHSTHFHARERSAGGPQDWLPQQILEYLTDVLQVLAAVSGIANDALLIDDHI